jgi:epoxyqueuosine reductase
MHRKVTERLLEPLARVVTHPVIFPWLRLMPPGPRKWRAYQEPMTGAWPPVEIRVPGLLKSAPGIRRDEIQESVAFEQGPLEDINDRFRAWYNRTLELWRPTFMAVGPRLQRALHSAEAVRRTKPALGSSVDEPADFTRRLRTYAASIGLNAIGIAQYDPKYTFGRALDDPDTVGDRVIVCVVEQNAASAALIPSESAEKGALSAYASAISLSARLADFIQRQGYRAVPENMLGTGVYIHYAVAAGLGQLGLNGQLLTPLAGPLVRLTVVRTDAPLKLDQAADYGIPKLCDACKVCIKRCPAGAIPAYRDWHRGVEKAKINTSRCYPVIAQAHGCAVCAKVCPVGKYGLQPVLDEFARSGRVLGKDSDELEGYDWIDGKHYGPESRPRLPSTFFRISER